MKKSLIGMLALGLVIGGTAVGLGMKTFANEKEVYANSFGNNLAPAASNVNQNSYTYHNNQFETLDGNYPNNQNTDQYNTSNDNYYRHHNNYPSECCTNVSSGNYDNIN